MQENPGHENVLRKGFFATSFLSSRTIFHCIFSVSDLSFLWNIIVQHNMICRVGHNGTFLSDHLGNEYNVALWPREFTDFFWWFLGVIFLAAKRLELYFTANYTKNWSCSNIDNLCTNRRRILRWFQKCIPLYAYLADFSSYGHLGPFFTILGKTGLFRPSNGHNSKYAYEICLRSCTFLKSAWKSASNGVPYIDIWATSNFGIIRGSQL